MNNLKIVFYLLIASITLVGCSTQNKPVEHQSDLIEITSLQLATDSMQFGEIQRTPFDGTIKCNGTVVPMPNGIALVSAPLAGVIKNIYCNSGQAVVINQALMEISGNEVIDIQKDMAEASANYKRLKNEFERVQALYNEKVTSEKDFIVVESDFKTAQARYQGLKLKTQAIGFSASRIEEGDFYSSYVIRSPINGHISSLKSSIGNYVEPQSGLLEIIDPSKLQIQLSVFATDVASLKKGQMVHFKPMNSTNTYNATISSVGVAVDNNSRSIECFASLTDKNLTYPIANQFVESQIVTGTDTVYALPSEAIIKTETGNYILVMEKHDDNKYFFNKVEINTGRQFNGYTEILGTRPNGEVLVKGVYNVVI